jgi:tetratricopeptide (TPR) repeat protein
MLARLYRPAFLAAVAALGWALPTKAMAQATPPHVPLLRKDAKDPLRESELAKKESTKVPERDLAGDITRHKKEKAAERPALDYDQYRLGVELQVASKRREQVETLQKIIQLGPSPREAPDLTFRLAELYWEESKFYFFEANRKDDDILRARAEKAPARVQQAEAEKKVALKKSEGFQALAIDQYRTIINKYPKYERMDEVLFFLGHNWWESGKTKEAETVYLKLIKDHSKSRYLPDAFLAVGQYHFNGSKGQRPPLEIALSAFKKAATYTESKVYGYALYMQGWCYYNLNDFRAAMDLFKAVVFFGELQGKADARSTALSKEARKDYVVAYSHIGDVGGAKADFQKVGGEEHWWGMLKGLANLYFEDGKDREASTVYKLMINERPLSPEAPFFQGRIVDCVVRVGNKKIIVAQVRELVRVLTEVEKGGGPKSADDKKALQDARELAERIMSNLAVNWHNEAKKTRDDAVFFLAAEVYQDYLEVFAGSPKAYDLRFFFAELLNDNLGRYDRAAEEYSRVLLEDIKKVEPPKDPKTAAQAAPQKPGRWMVDAAYNAILAYDEVAKKADAKEGGDGAAKDPKGRTAMPLHQKNLLVACERYIKYVPAGEKLVEVTYKAGYIYYRYNDFERAVPLLAWLALEHADHSLAETAANLVLDAYNLLGDWAKVNEWARRFFAQPKLAKGKLRDDLARVLEQSAFKLVNLAESKEDYLTAAEAYLTFANEFPKSELADLALYNASVDFFKGRQVDRSVETRRQLVQRYPASRYLPQCIYANGESFETIGEFEQAAEAYEAYAAGWAEHKKPRGAHPARPKARAAAPKAAGAVAGKDDEKGASFEEAKAQVALFNAGVFREGLGQFKLALRDRNRYLDLWPEGKDSEAVFLSVADLHEKDGAAFRAVAQVEEYQRRYGRDPDKLLASELRLARLDGKLNRPREVAKVLARAKDYYEKRLTRAQREKLSAASIEVVAKANYQAIEPDFVEYAKITFPKDEKQLKSAVEAKHKALEKVLRRYTEVIGLKAAEPAICSLYKIGLLYKNFAEALNSAPVPEMPFPPQLNQIKHLWNVPYHRWPRDFAQAISENDYKELKKKVEDARQEFEQAYRGQLGQFEGPLHDKAAEAFATTVEKARELTLFNDCSQKALDLLSDKYRPTQFPRVVERPMEFKAAQEQREGNALLAAVQAVPEPPKAPPKRGAAQEPPPDLSRLNARAAPGASGDKLPAPEPSALEGPPDEPLSRQRPAAGAKAASEPDDPDLIH